MFYGNFRGERRDQFTAALANFRTMFRRVYANDNLITFDRNQSFLWDEAFREAFAANATTEQEKSLLWRLHTLCWAARHCLSVEGDFVECGVWRGFSFAVVTRCLGFEALDKTLYLYDTFTGIPDDYNSENRSNAVYEREPDLYDKVVQRFRAYPNVRIVPGVVPDTFAQVCPERISLLHLDMNSSKSEIEALKVLYERITPGGILVLDDFGWSGYARQTVAEVEFMAERGTSILELPTGQGLVIKR